MRGHKLFVDSKIQEQNRHPSNVLTYLYSLLGKTHGPKEAAVSTKAKETTDVREG